MSTLEDDVAGTKEWLVTMKKVLADFPDARIEETWLGRVIVVGREHAGLATHVMAMSAEPKGADSREVHLSAYFERHGRRIFVAASPFDGIGRHAGVVLDGLPEEVRRAVAAAVLRR